MQLGSYRRFAILLPIVLLVFARSARGLSGADSASEIRLKPVLGTPVMLVPVYVNHQGPFQFLLDTGADETIVDVRLAKRLALPKNEWIEGSTVGGSWHPNRTTMEELEAGPASVRDFAALEADLSAVRGALPEVKGILGQDFLSRFNYLLSYKDRSILFERSDEIRDTIRGEPVQLERPLSRMVVEAQTTMASEQKLRLLLDSGANTLVLNKESAAAASIVVTGTAIETTANARLLLVSGRIDQLTIASHRFYDVPVTLSALPQIEGFCDGLLPTAFFKAIYVNNREGFVEFIEDSRGGDLAR
jgi:predicted aspartyl protease